MAASADAPTRGHNTKGGPVEEPDAQGGPGRGRGLAFTRHCFTSKLHCGSQLSFYCCPPPNLQRLPYCDTTARPGFTLAFTRYSFSSRLVCMNQPSFHPSRPPAMPTLWQYLYTIIEQYTTPLPTSRVYAIHHTILVMTISCKCQGLPRGT